MFLGCSPYSNQYINTASMESIYNKAIVWEVVCEWKLGILHRVKRKCLFWEQVQAFALVNKKPTCDWERPQLGRQQRELTKLIRRGWHVKVSCGLGVSSITYVSFVAGEVAPLFVNWWRFAPPSLWVEALTCGGPDSEERLFLCLPDACCSSCPTPSQT